MLLQVLLAEVVEEDEQLRRDAAAVADDRLVAAVPLVGLLLGVELVPADEVEPV